MMIPSVQEHTIGAETHKKSVIDYILINQKMFNMYTSVHIDEGQKTIDISDHNLLTLNFNINNKTQNYIKHGQWEE